MFSPFHFILILLYTLLHMRRHFLSFDALLQCERELKGYVHSQRDIIEKLIVKLIYIMKTGEALD